MKMSSEVSPPLRRSARLSAPPVNKEESVDNASASKKWTEEEQRKLLRCLKIHGHKDINKIVEELPERSKEEIRKYLIFIHSQAHKKREHMPEVNYWVMKCVSETEKKNMVKTRDSMQVAQVLKFLSVDGLLECHPKPRSPHDIDFSAAYKLLYQVLMGYPVQPVNRATAEFIFKTVTNVTNSKNRDLIDKLTLLMKEKFKSVQVSQNKEVAVEDEDVSAMQVIMPTRVYTRKRPAEKPPLRINVSLVEDERSHCTKGYTVEMSGRGEPSQTISIPILSEVKRSKLDTVVEDLWKSPGFNPFEIPGVLLKKSKT